MPVLTREYARNPILLSEILETVQKLEDKGIEPTFNSILNELAARRVLSYHRTLRKYLDLLVSAKLLTINYEKAIQPNIREKQVYHKTGNPPSLEAGEKALLLHGLNWDIPFPRGVSIKTDLDALALAKISGNTAYASLEDTIVQSLKPLTKRYAERASEFIMFATALLATQKVNFNYLLRRAKQKGVEQEVIEILLCIDKALASPQPKVEDILTLYKLRNIYSHKRRQLLKSIEAHQRLDSDSLTNDMPSSNQVVEYAGKQLGLRG